MSKIQRRVHARRDLEEPISEWSQNRLMAELKRLETAPAELNVWQIFKRRSELENQLKRLT